MVLGTSLLLRNEPMRGLIADIRFVLILVVALSTGTVPTLPGANSQDTIRNK